MEIDREALLVLKDGDSHVVSESDYGKAEIWVKNGYYFLFEIPNMGGELFFSGCYKKGDVDLLIRTVKSWN